MPRFQCLKGYWPSPIEVETIRDAEMIFRCPDCAMNDSHCLVQACGLPQVSTGKPKRPPLSQGSKDHKIVAALSRLTQVRPKSVRLTYATSEEGRACRNLRGLVQTYYDEILSARTAGHGFNTIAQVLTESGAHIHHRTLTDYFNAIWRATNDQA